MKNETEEGLGAKLSELPKCIQSRPRIKKPCWPPAIPGLGFMANRPRVVALINYANAKKKNANANARTWAGVDLASL